MSFRPMFLPRRIDRGKAASVAVVVRQGHEFVDFRFSPEVCKQAGWARFDRVAPFYDPGSGHLMLASSSGTESSARALGFQGGHQLAVRWPRLDAFCAVRPGPRCGVRVVRCGDGQVVLDLRSIKPGSTPHLPTPTPSRNPTT